MEFSFIKKYNPMLIIEKEDVIQSQEIDSSAKNFKYLKNYSLNQFGRSDLDVQQKGGSNFGKKRNSVFMSQNFGLKRANSRIQLENRRKSVISNGAKDKEISLFHVQIENEKLMKKFIENEENVKSELSKTTTDTLVEESRTTLTRNLISKCISKGIFQGLNEKMFVVDVIAVFVWVFSFFLVLTENWVYMNDVRNITKDTVLLPDEMKVDFTKDLIVNREVTSAENSLRIANCFFTILLAILSIIRRWYVLRIEKTTGLAAQFDSLLGVNRIFPLLVEFVFLCITSIPFTNYVMSGEFNNTHFVYNITSIYLVVICLKGYIVLRMYFVASRWASEYSRIICRQYNVVHHVLFFFKAEMKHRPVKFFLGIIFLTVLFCTICFQIFEFGLIHYRSEQKFSSNNFLDPTDGINALWCIISSLLTIGYGDIYPLTYLGRVTSIISCLIGIVSVSYLIVTLGKNFYLTTNEVKAFQILQKLRGKRVMENKAVDVIINILMLNMGRKENSKLDIMFLRISILKRSITIFKSDGVQASGIESDGEIILNRIESQLDLNINRFEREVKKMEEANNQLLALVESHYDISDKVEGLFSAIGDFSEKLIELNNREFMEEKDDEAVSMKFKRLVSLESEEA